MNSEKKRLVLQVEGMTCPSCERKLEKGLAKVVGVTDVKASYQDCRISLDYDPETVTPEMLLTVVEKLGYSAVVSDASVGDTRCAAGNNLRINQILGMGIIVFALYWLMNSTFSANFLPEIDASVGYGMLFGIGVLTSLHCIAMCGGINLSQSIAGGQSETPPASGVSLRWTTLKPSLYYNAGRVVSYTLIGGLVGALGSVLSFSSAAKGTVTIFSGVLMVVFGLNMLNLFPWLRRFQPRLPKFLGKALEAKRGKLGPFGVGLLNGLMPCGPLQTMQMYALGTGSFFGGAAAMFLFSLGTVPLMFGLGAISTILSRKFTGRMLKFSAILVIVLGLVMVNRGLSLSGKTFAISDGGSQAAVAQLQGTIQTVTTGFDQGRYQPFVVQKGVPVRWIIQARPEDLNGCNNPIAIPEYGIEKRLVPGENIIEFTPTKEGNITYTCWMGMISSNIKVVKDLEQVSPDDLTAPPSTGGSGGCCAF